MTFSKQCKVGLFVGLSFCTIASGAVLAESPNPKFDGLTIGGFVKTASFEPTVEGGQKDCQDMSNGFCTGGAVAAVAEEFPDFGSDLVRDMAFNLANATPFLNSKLRNARTAKLDDEIEIRVNLIKAPEVAALEDAGFDLTIPVNAKATTTAKIDDLGAASDFKFEKNYQHLTF